MDDFVFHRHPEPVCHECSGWSPGERHIAAAIAYLGEIMTEFASDQAHEDADVAAIEAAEAKLTTVEQALLAEVTALKAQPGAENLNFTGLDTIAAKIAADAAAEAGDVPPVTAPTVADPNQPTVTAPTPVESAPVATDPAATVTEPAAAGDPAAGVAPVSDTPIGDAAAASTPVADVAGS